MFQKIDVKKMDGNASSKLLTSEENGQIGELIQWVLKGGYTKKIITWLFVRRAHRKNRIMAVSVVKLYLSDANTKQPAWAERVTGTATLTKDYGRKSYYIQIFEMQYYQQVLTYIFRLNVELWIVNFLDRFGNRSSTWRLFTKLLRFGFTALKLIITWLGWVLQMKGEFSRIHTEVPSKLGPENLKWIQYTRFAQKCCMAWK